MRAVRWAERRRNEHEWRRFGWLIVVTATLDATMLLKEGYPPIAVLPEGMSAEAREYVLGGMMLAVAERFPEELNPMQVLNLPSDYLKDTRPPHQLWGNVPGGSGDTEVGDLVEQVEWYEEIIRQIQENTGR